MNKNVTYPLCYSAPRNYQYHVRGIIFMLANDGVADAIEKYILK
jgi:hypothetical protein